ncbi:MAG: DbpA RNA binding domain-containing protein, partial [Rhodospirillales bacterium]|nr:DbpA RNA binding domain-containing protein [Rhodospirillales bacterium]
AKHSAEQIAAAFVRQHRAGQSAPEELLDHRPPERKKPQRDNFQDGVWISLSVGRKDAAEARWLLPMLCRAGQISNREIGAIRIQDSETYVELTAECIDKFIESVGTSRELEKNVTLTRLDGMPAGLKPAPSGGHASDPKGNSYAKKRPFRTSKPDRAARGERSGEDRPRSGKPWDKKPWDKKPRDEKRGLETSGEPTRDEHPKKSKDKKLKKLKPKNTHRAQKRKLAKQAGKAGKADAGGNSPRMRRNTEAGG